jgi:hypothetical protein
MSGWRRRLSSFVRDVRHPLPYYKIEPEFRGGDGCLVIASSNLWCALKWYFVAAALKMSAKSTPTVCFGIAITAIVESSARSNSFFKEFAVKVCSNYPVQCSKHENISNFI